jgi:hypothetical protein
MTINEMAVVSAYKRVVKAWLQKLKKAEGE